MRPLLRVLGKRVGDRTWDLFLRATAAAALVGIPVTLAFPKLTPLVWLAVLAIPANGPLSPILPTFFEPLIMEAAKYQAAIWVTLVALSVYLWMEVLNWHLYAWVLNWERFAGLRTRPWVQRAIQPFARSPFGTVVLFAFTPIPFWVARCLAILHAYPLRRFMVATAVGRLPRFFAYAWVGEQIRVSSVLLAGVVIAGAAILIVWRLARGERVLADPVLSSTDPATCQPAEVASGAATAHGPKR